MNDLINDNFWGKLIVMEQSPQEGTQQEECRRTAAKAFMESLDQLGQRLQSCEAENAEPTFSKSNLQPQQPPLCSQAIDVQAIDAQALEDAAADIEQFMQMMQSKNTTASGADPGADSPTPQG